MLQVRRWLAVKWRTICSSRELPTEVQSVLFGREAAWRLRYQCCVLTALHVMLVDREAAWLVESGRCVLARMLAISPEATYSRRQRIPPTISHADISPLEGPHKAFGGQLHSHQVFLLYCTCGGGIALWPRVSTSSERLSVTVWACSEAAAVQDCSVRAFHA